MKRRGALVLLLMGALAVGSLALRSSPARAQSFGYHSLNKIQKRLVSSALIAILGPSSASSGQASRAGGGDNGDGADGAPNVPPASYSSASSALGSAGNFLPSGSGQCSANHGANNIKVNQNCLNISDADLQGRGQANNETSIAQDPFHPNHIVASDNDYIRGDGTCGSSYSTDSGVTWNNSTVPNSFTRGAAFGGFARQYWQAGGDTSVAWDTRGNAYLSCQLFNRGNAASSNPDQSSTFLVFRSTGNNGASWDFPGRQVTSFFDPTGTAGVLEDKQLVAVDNHVSSPFRDRVYVTWTEFAADGTAYIYEAYSNTYGQSFSPRVLVSQTSALCSTTFGLPTPNGTCNENQFSQPFVGGDGALYVTFDNYNNTVTGSDNRNQILLAKSVDGGSTFSAPVKVSDFYDLPDCFTYQGDDYGRACVPEKGSSTRSVFRAANYSAGQVNPTNPNQIVVTVGSYINIHSKETNGCAPAGFAGDGINLYTGVKTAGACNNKILVSVSDNGGATFSGARVGPRFQRVVNQSAGQARTDQFWQWTAFTTSGNFAVSYYDRQYGTDEIDGSSDVSLSTSNSLGYFVTGRVTSSSMPPPTQFYGRKGGLFYGDYTGLTAVTTIHPLWSDTRSLDLFTCQATAISPPQLCIATETNAQTANDQDIYTGTFPAGY